MVLCLEWIMNSCESLRFFTVRILKVCMMTVTCAPNHVHFIQSVFRNFNSYALHYWYTVMHVFSVELIYSDFISILALHCRKIAYGEDVLKKCLCQIVSSKWIPCVPYLAGWRWSDFRLGCQPSWKKELGTKGKSPYMTSFGRGQNVWAIIQWSAPI